MDSVVSLSTASQIDRQIAEVEASIKKVEDDIKWLRKN